MKTKLSQNSQVLGNPRILLQTELARRCEVNPRYSLRAFSRSIGISHTVLSLVLSGKRNLSRKATLKLADCLELSPDERARLLSTHRKDLSIKESAEEIRYRRLSMDTFEVISDWYHYAILSVLELPDAQFEPRWLARRLGITVMQAKLAQERLERLGMVERGADGKWRQSGKPLKVDNQRSTEATRCFHKQLLARAVVSLEEDPIEIRGFTSMTFAVNPQLVGYAKKRIREFQRELAGELEAQGAPSEVYNLTVQLFPVTRSEIKTVKRTQTQKEKPC